jgi:hypothetical protein
MGCHGWSGEARGSHGGPFWRCARTFPPGPLWRTYVLVGRLPAVPAVPYFGDVLGGYPPPGPATWFDAVTAGSGNKRSSQKQSLQEDTDQNLLLAASRGVGAYVCGTGLIRGCSLAPRVICEADGASF